jgi:hypothetical protein
MEALADWLAERTGLLATLAAISFATLLISILLVPILIRRMPADYFLERRPLTETLKTRHPLSNILLKALKNSLGLILLLAGLIMILTPGQGVLTILVGLILMDFPGKRSLELRLVRIPPIHRTIRWIRHRAKKPDLLLPPRSA